MEEDKQQKCDICLQPFRIGMKVKVIDYVDKRIFRKWYVIPKRRNVWVCDKCRSTLYGLVRYYRKERIQ